MPLLLCRYILIELLKVLALTTLVLVTVIAFGAAVKPLAQSALLDGTQTIKYILLATIPMLQFALPFAAGFAATIVLHRAATDNEILAMAASGISYRQILMPIAALGIVLTGAMIVLTQTVIPRFWVMMQEVVITEATQMFEASVERGEPFTYENELQIYAAKMIVDDTPAESEADARLQLWRVAAAELDDNGRVEKDVTAGRAVVDFYRSDEQTYLMLKLLDAVAYDHASGELLSFPEVHYGPFRVPNQLSDNTKLMSRSELKELRKRPERYRQLQREMDDLAEQIAGAELNISIANEVRDDGEFVLQSLRDADVQLRVRASAMKRGDLVTTGDQPVHVEMVQNGEVRRLFDARRATLVRSADALDQTKALELILWECSVREAEAERANVRDRVAFSSLELAEEKAAPLEGLNVDALLARAAPFEQTNVSLAKEAQDVRDKVVKLNREISTRLHSRYALSITALLLLLLGATLAIWLRDALPLTVYLLAFLPSVLDLLMISGGDQLMRDGSPLGVVVMWGGSAVMAGAVAWSFWKLKQH